MHLLSAYISVAVLGYLSAGAPFGLRSGLISQDPKNYAPNLASGLFGAGRGSSPDDSTTPEEPNLDDAADDDEDLIPGDLLEGDNDSGGESDIGNDAVSVANGLLGGGGAGSAALNNKTSGSTAVFCSLFACASAAQSDGKVSTSATGARIHASGPLISIKGPLVVIQASRKSVTKA